MYQERLLFVNEHVSVYRSYFTQHVIQYQRRLTSMINQASTTRCTRIYVNNSLSWKNILYMESQINNPSFVFLTFGSTSVHVLLEVHYVTIQIRPVLYMLLTNLGFIRKMNYKMYKQDFLNTQYYTSYSIEYYFTYDTVCKLLIAYFANYSNSLYSKINKGIR